MRPFLARQYFTYSNRIPEYPSDLKYCRYFEAREFISHKEINIKNKINGILFQNYSDLL